MNEHKPGTFKPINVLGVRVGDVSVHQLHDHITSSITQNKRCVIPNVNVHCINIAFNQPWLRAFLNDAPFVFVDGYGVILGAYLLGYRLTHRITYAEWMWKLSEFCAQNGFSLYFLGAMPGVADRAAAVLSARHPDLMIKGVQHGYFNRSNGSKENRAIIDAINAKKPNILVVGFGMPLQEQWLLENWGSLDVNVGLTGGAVFDYVSGDMRRGPRLLTDHGFEWMARFVLEPGRLWKRYIIGNPLFLLRVVRQRLGLLHINQQGEETRSP